MEELETIEEIDFYSKIGQKIKQIRKEKELSQEQLSNKIGLSRTSITNIELGKQAILGYTLFKITKALDVDIIELLPIEICDKSNVSNKLVIREIAKMLKNHKKAMQNLSDINNDVMQALTTDISATATKIALEHLL